MNKTVTVLMSTYNGEKYIAQQIESILAQEECDISIIARDDGSSDSTLAILRQYEETGKLTFYTGDNLGPAKSFITLIMKAPESEYYAFADQDDVWLPEKIKSAIEMMEKYSERPALYSSNMKRANSEMDIIAERALPNDVATDFESVMTVSGRLFGCTMVFNKKMADFVKACPMPGYIIMHDLWLAMIASAYDALIYDPVPYIKYRTHSSSVTFSKNIPLLKKIRSMFVGTKDQYSRQCGVFVEYMGENKLKELGHWEICELLLNYKKSILKKIRLQMIMLKKHDMSFKLRMHHCVQILFGKY